MGWITTKHHIWVIGVELLNTLHYQNFHFYLGRCRQFWSIFWVMRLWLEMDQDLSLTIFHVHIFYCNFDIHETLFNYENPCWNPSTRSKVTIDSCLMSADLYSILLIWAHYWIGLEMLPQNDSSHVEIPPLVQKLQKDLVWCQLICTVNSWSDLTIGLGCKCYPKMTPPILKSLHWFKSYNKILFDVSWFVQ